MNRQCAARRDLSNRRTMEFDETAVRGAFGIQQSVVAFANSDGLPAKSSGRIHSTVNHPLTINWGRSHMMTFVTP